MNDIAYKNMMDFDPFQNTIGYDKMFDRIYAHATDFNTGKSQKYPPYNIIKVSDNNFEIEMAIAGFTEDELDIMTEDGILTVRGSSIEDGTDENYIHRGIARRDFIRKFTISDTIEINGASMENGLLKIRLENIIPEHKKAKRIQISGNGNGVGSKKEPQFLTENEV